MTRLIDADALREKWLCLIGDFKASDFVCSIDIAPTVDAPTNDAVPSHSGLIGWVCPVCGRGLSPYTTVCPCQNQKGWEITCG